MHDLIFAVAFVAMVATPAMVAAIGGRKEYNPGPELPALRPGTAMTVRPPAPPVHPRSKQKAAPVEHRLVTSDGPTLPMHNARGMAGR
ncbi:MAG TPA: hypothetical protein VHZ25_14555 [Acidobacteriaceae bacterium]|jgi:hypothetical protein|nr:hypothetical protein [Acidobacteriaceae bacterium]